MSSNHSELMSKNYSESQPPSTSRLLTNNQVSDHTFFVDATWLKQQIDNENENLIILDVTRGEGNYKLDVTRMDSDYEEKHIPHSLHMSTDELGEFKDYFLPAKSLKEAFLKKGVTKGTLLVVYSVYARDILYIASRVAFAAYYLGVDQVKILDGGIQAWKAAGYEFETGINSPIPAEYFGVEVPARKEILVRTPGDVLKAKAENPDVVLASVRTWNEFIGENEGHSWNKGAGEIFGSVYAGDEKLANVDGKMANPEAYLDDWTEWGITSDKDIIFYCGTSWRSSTAFFCGETLGMEKYSDV